MANATEPKPGDIFQEDDKFFQIGETGDKVRISEEQAKERGWTPGVGQPDPENLRGRDDPERRAVREAGKSPEAAAAMTHEERQDAVEWFMSDNPDEEPATESIELNVSTDPDKEVWVEWIVKVVPRERIQDIRDKSKKKGKKRSRNQEEEANTTLANLKIATEGTAYPDLRDPKVRGDFLDPADALNYRFRNKPGLIDQICAAVIEVSGYDEDDVREVDAVKT